MKKYIAKRIMLMFVTAFVTMTVLFVLIRLLPNHVHAALGGYAKQEEMMREVPNGTGAFVQKSVLICSR